MLQNFSYAVYLNSLSANITNSKEQIHTNTFRIEISFCLSFDSLSGVFLRLILLIATGCVVYEIKLLYSAKTQMFTSNSEPLKTTA